MKKISSSEIETLHDEYTDIYPVLEEVTNTTREKISSLLGPLDAPLSYPLQSRIKSWESVREKLGRGEVRIRKITEMQDLIGFRLIVLFMRDVEAIEDILSTSFRVIKKLNTKERLGVDKFGYLSTHYVVDLGSIGLDPTDRRVPNLRAEIQVRTVAQHLWAEISHRLSYKREGSVPPTLLRDLHETAALLENVDSSFERILTTREEYRQGVLDIEEDRVLDVEILQVTLERLWPLENKLKQEPYEYLLHYLKRNGFDTQKKVTSLVRKQRDQVIKRSAREAEYLRNLINSHPIKDGTIKVVLPNKTVTHSNITEELIERAKRGIRYGHVALTVTALQFHQGERNPLDPLE